MAIEVTALQEFTILTLDRVDHLNALNGATLLELQQAFDQVEASPARVLFITGRGTRAFCAGADVNELAALPLFAQKESLMLGQRVFSRLDRLTIPSIALMRGFAFGGGLELALACTFRLGEASTKLGFPEVKLGLIPGYGGTQRLGRLIGTCRALDLIMTGRTVDAAEALEIGLLTELVDTDLVEAGVVFARRFSSFGLRTLWLARQAVQRAQDLGLHEGLDVESDLAALALASDNATEGMAAFIGKRRPKVLDH